MDRPLQIGLLECDHVDDRYRSIAGDYSDMFRAMVAHADPTAHLVRYDAVAGELPARPDECDAWLCSGSRASVYDDQTWIGELAVVVQAVHDAHVPFVGVCFGHQLLAHALGGRTERAPGGWGVGALTMSVLGGTAWMAPRLPSATLLYSHQDQVVELPRRGRVLAAADHCPVAMLAVGEDMLGIQAHPEFCPPYVRALLQDRVDRIGRAQTLTALGTLDAPLDDRIVAAWILGFLRHGLPQA